MKRTFNNILLVFLFVIHLSASAQTLGNFILPEHNSQSFSIYFDNDYLTESVFKGLNEDRNYTMGLGLAYSSTALNKTFIFAPNQLIGRILGIRDPYWLVQNPRKFKKRSNKKYNPFLVRFPATIVLAGTAFTPDNLGEDIVITEDRPYSSLIFLSTRSHWLNIKSNTYHQISLDFGFFGLNLAREVQTYIHQRIFNGTEVDEPVIPQGWGLQISQGGEPTVAAKYEIQKLIGSFRRCGGKKTWADWKIGAAASLGYNTFASGHIKARIGFLNPGTWTYSQEPLGLAMNADLEKKNLDQDLMDGLQKEIESKKEVVNLKKKIQDPLTFKKQKELKQRKNKKESQPSTYIYNRRRGEFFLFASLKGFAVANNVHLQGQFKESAYTLSASEIRRFILEGFSGIGYKIPITCSGQYSIVGNAGIHWRTEEYYKPLASRHVWGTINLGVTF